MAESNSHNPPNLSDSGITIPTDSENYDANNEMSSSPPSSSSSPMILYSPPTIWGLLRGAAINLFLPFVNGLMLGFGELLAHEAAFRFGWSGTKVIDPSQSQGKCYMLLLFILVANSLQIFPSHRQRSHPVGPGVELREDSVARRRANGQELDMYTAME
ncbi:TOM13-domain-containing protein [Aulographum hederae CBS 113979]|uniref:TOM13-domain-containing protein n=1 Tax=Aulographum hederae CBS 113979 TaxID=1176131 RepID=A0A6G1H077_9PEZI|nr:TOM13-domain-containing protein [Aulographum hederae CBS 113979]